MTDKHTYCIIMAGGIGSRFWPMSRTAHPKQFLDFLGHGRTLIQQTFDRFLDVCPAENIYVVTNAQYAPLVHEQLPALRPEQVLLEPDRRNTAPCIAYANHHAKAQQFLDSGEYLWNSGIFIWSLASIRKAFRKHLPEMEVLFSTGENAYGTPNEAEFIAKIYGTCESISIDYGILEKADNVYVVAGDFGWSDLGTWGSLYSQLPKDANANAGTSKTVRVYDGKDNMVHVQDDRLVVLQGLEDFIVVSTPDALLVCRKHDEQKIKGIVQELTKDIGEKYI
ncbi:MAG: mannose-1-phosphate guanylyltransferase [Flavobacteriales bacterium]|nr:mannose-1-phosphate guanylyltransferase [Flavobacteriales bacterium]